MIKQNYSTLRRIGAVVLSIAMWASAVSSQAEQQIFRNSSEIPPPEKGGASTATVRRQSNAYIQLPNVAPQPTPPLPAGLRNGKTTIARAKQDSLTDAALVAPEPISLDASVLHQQTVAIENDDTHIVPVSGSSMNRINTPFRNPIVLVNGGAKYKVVGQDVYVVMDTDQPTGIFIREDDNLANNSPVASLTLVPKSIAPQNIVVVLANALRDRLSNPNAKIATDYQDVIRTTLAAISQGKLPDGYSRSNVTQNAIARVGSVVLKPKTLYSGVENNVYVYDAQNVTSDYVELSEPSFWHKGVRAVSFDGKIRLAPQDHTKVMIIADVGDGNDSIHD